MENSGIKVIGKLLFFLLICSVTNGAEDDCSTQQVSVYYGTSDVSAAVAISDKMFVVADDENNLLRVYRTTQTCGPVYSYDLTQFLEAGSKHPEADIEGATVVGETVYWITSHGRNKDGKMRPNRYRFFATEITVQNDNISVEPVGVPCRTLVHSLLKVKGVCELDLEKAAGFNALYLTDKQRRELAPKKAGLNIEGLCASADGRTLYIGFRNPLVFDEGGGLTKAIVVPLENARDVIEKQREPVFGEPMLWDLNGLGIRSMEYSGCRNAYFILAGPKDEQQDFALYRWSGEKAAQPTLVRKISTGVNSFSPEAMVSFEGSEKLLLLSDDGALEIEVSEPSECMEGELLSGGRCLNKYLTDPSKKIFRAVWFQAF